MVVRVGRKKDTNIFSTPQRLKKWALDLSDECGSVLTNTPPNIRNIDKLVETFVKDYNYSMEKINKEQAKS